MNKEYNEKEEVMFTCEQEDQLDAIDNAAFELLQILSDDEDFEWNMELIGDVVDAAVSVLHEHNYNAYYPYETEENGKDVIYDYETVDGNGLTKEQAAEGKKVWKVIWDNGSTEVTGIDSTEALRQFTEQADQLGFTGTSADVIIKFAGLKIEK